MKRQILSLILACVMIFGVVALAGCNNGTKKQVEDLQAQVNELKSQSEANAASAAQANKQLADEKASSEAAIESQKTALESMESALKVLQNALDATKTELQTTKEELNQALEEKKEELEQAGGIPEQSYDEATNALPEKKNELKAAYEAAKAAAVASAWLYTENQEANLAEIDALYKKALNDLDKATSVEKQNAIIAKFIADASAFVPVPLQIYNAMMAYYDAEKAEIIPFTHEMVDDVRDILDAYDAWLEESGKTAAEFDAYMAEQGTALDPTFARLVKRFDKAVNRADQLEAAVRDAAAINARVAAVKADLEEEKVHLEADWEELKQLRIDIPAWEDTYFPANTPYYQERPLVGTQGTPNGSANWRLIDRAMVDEAERLMRDLLNKYIDAGLTFIMSVEALDETPNLLSYGKIDVAKKALDDYIKLRKIDFGATFDFILAEFGELVEPDITPFIATFAEKRAAYQLLVEEAKDAYNAIVSQNLMKRAALYYSYILKTGDTYAYAIDDAKTLFMTTSTYPVYDVNPILDWYKTYGVWRDADGNIVDNEDLTDECEISWTSDEFAVAWTWLLGTTDRADIGEILEDAEVTETDTVYGYMLNYTTKDYSVWTINPEYTTKTINNVGVEYRYAEKKTVKLTDADYAWITGYDLRTIEIAIEALMAETPILTGSEAMVNDLGHLYTLIADATGVAFTPAKYIEKYDLLRGLVRALEDKTDEDADVYYWDLDLDMDDYHWKNYFIEGINAYGKEVQASLTENGDTLGTKAIRQLLIQYVGDIEAICPTDTAAEKAAQTEDKCVDMAMQSFLAAASFAAVEQISEEYLELVEEVGDDEDLLSALYGVYAQAVISEKIDDQIIPCLLRTFAQTDGFIGIANTVSLTEEQFALALGQEENPEG